MKRNYRKLGHGDFRRRVKTVDKVFFRTGVSANDAPRKRARPITCLLIGLAWAYLLLALPSHQDAIHASLAQGTLSAQHTDWIFFAMAGFMGASGVLLLVQMVRFVLQPGPQRTNSGAVLLGALAAFALVKTPAPVWQAGYAILDDNTRAIVQSAGAKLTELTPQALR